MVDFIIQQINKVIIEEYCDLYNDTIIAKEQLTLILSLIQEECKSTFGLTKEVRHAKDGFVRCLKVSHSQQSV